MMNMPTSRSRLVASRFSPFVVATAYGLYAFHNPSWIERLLAGVGFGVGVFICGAIAYFAGTMIAAKIAGVPAPTEHLDQSRIEFTAALLAIAVVWAVAHHGGEQRVERIAKCLADESNEFKSTNYTYAQELVHWCDQHYGEDDRAPSDDE